MNDLNTFNNDLLNRKQLALNLTNIIKFNCNLRVLAIDSNWGTGKTTFINMWKNMLDNNDEYKDIFQTMYFNAWENDYISDPLSSLLIELENQIKTKENKIKSLFEKGKDRAMPYAKIGGQILLKYLTKGVLDNIDLNNVLEEGLTELSDKLGEMTFKEITIAKQSREALKDDLKKFQDNMNKKVIIFIDELDRCKPTFAVELLETIKHIFNLDNYIFIISLDKEQLSHSIKTLYGQDMDSDGYLRRFFDLEYNLPNNNTLKYIQYKNEDISSNYKNTTFLTKFIEEIFIQENYSLRDINKAYDYINILLPNIQYFSPTTDKNYRKSYLLVVSYLYTFFINLRIKHNMLYRSIRNLSYTPTEDFITEKLLTFDINKFNLNMDGYADIRAKEIIKPLIPLYLELLYKVNNTTNYYHQTDNDINKYIVGIKQKDGSYYYESDVDLLYFIKDNNILNNLEFANDFNI